MRASYGQWSLPLAALAALAGCNRSPAPQAGTGAEETAKQFYEAFVLKDLSRAYALLDPAGRNHYSEQQFNDLAVRQLNAMGFEPREVYVRPCEEHGTEAVAHIVVTGQATSRQRSYFYKDAVMMRRDGGGWGVVLSPRFGQRTDRQP
jgi:hypothetical protein